jgi:hypothetical protein
MRRWAELTSMLVGATAALVMLSGWRIPHGVGSAPAGVTLSASGAPGIELARTGDFASSTQLLADGRSTVQGTLEVHNPGGHAVAIHARLRGDTTDLDAAVVIQLSSDALILYRGRLGGLRHWTRPGILIGAGKSAPITVRGAIRAHAQRWQGRQVVATLELDARETP